MLLFFSQLRKGRILVMKFTLIQQKSLAKGLAGLSPLAASCLWGGLYVVNKASFSSIPPITLGLLRLLVGGAVLWVALQITSRLRHTSSMQGKLSRQELRRLPLLGACVAATVITQSVGTNLATAHDGALLTTTTPIFILPLAWLLLGERPGWRVIAGMLVAMVGIVLVVELQQGRSSSTTSWGQALLGDTLLIVSALLWALFTVLGTPLVRRSSALVVSTYASLWSLLFMAPFALWEVMHHAPALPTIASVGSVLYLGIGATALAWFLWYKGVERLPASVAAVFFFAQPVVGGLLSALFLHETLGINFWLGGAVLAGGIVLASFSPISKTKREDNESHKVVLSRHIS
jgi:drug/metabolite transporter (DMT)-like permease